MKTRTQPLGTPALLPLLGPSLIFAWAYAPLLVGERFYLLHHAGFALSLVAIAAISVGGKLDKLPPRLVGAISVASCIAMALAPLALIAPQALNNTAAVVVGGPLSGLGAAWAFARWFALFCRFRTQLAVGYTLVSFSLSAALRFALVPLSGLCHPLGPAVLAVLPFFALLLERRARAIDPGRFALTKPKEDRGNLLEKRSFWNEVGFFAEIAVCGIAFGVLRNGIAEWSSTNASLYMGHLLRILMPLLLLAWVTISPSDERKAGILHGCVLAVAFAVLVGIFFSESAGVVISALTLAMRNLVTILLYMMLFRLVRDYPVEPIAAFGIGRGVYELALSGGLALFATTGVSSLMAKMPITTFYFVIACLTLLLLSTFARISTAVCLANLQPPAAENASAGAKPDAYEAVASLYQLSEREAEVMRLLCSGRTKRHIAETLFLSEDTVRWHAKQLYRKLDVHSKQQLIDLVDRF